MNVVRPSTSARGQPAVGQRVLDRLDGQLELGPAGLLGELGGADAGDRGLAGERHAATWMRTVPVTWSPSETLPTTEIVAMPSSTESTVPLNVSVS